jgi:plasmid stability protein
VATLNIKRFPDDLYAKLRARAARTRRSVSQEVVYMLARELEGPDTTSIMELRGLGKQHWRDVDPAEHVSAERDAWD